MSGPILGDLSNNRWSGDTLQVQKIRNLLFSMLSQIYLNSFVKAHIHFFTS